MWWHLVSMLNPGQLIAQVDPAHATANTWMQVVAGIASLGFAVWYAWYTTTKTIPDMNKQHSENMQAAIEQFRLETKEQRELFERRQTESHELAKLQYDSIGKLSAAISDLRAEIKQHR